MELAHRHPGQLKWNSRTGIGVSWLLARHLAAALPRELLRGWSRFRGRYDTAIATVRRLRPAAGDPGGRVTAAGHRQVTEFSQGTEVRPESTNRAAARYPQPNR